MIRIGDADASGDLTVTLSVDRGVLDVNAGRSGVEVSGNNSDEVTLTGSLAELQLLFRDDDAGDLDFIANTDDPPGTATLTVSVDDGIDTTAGTLVIPIVPVPDIV